VVAIKIATIPRVKMHRTKSQYREVGIFEKSDKKQQYKNMTSTFLKYNW